MGSVRHEADERLLEGLRHLARELQVETHVQFSKNVSFSELLDRLQRSVVGLHTMWNEHFGIGLSVGAHFPFHSLLFVRPHIHLFIYS